MLSSHLLIWTPSGETWCNIKVPLRKLHIGSKHASAASPSTDISQSSRSAGSWISVPPVADWPMLDFLILRRQVTTSMATLANSQGLRGNLRLLIDQELQFKRAMSQQHLLKQLRHLTAKITDGLSKSYFWRMESSSKFKPTFMASMLLFRESDAKSNLPETNMERDTGPPCRKGLVSNLVSTSDQKDWEGRDPFQ